MSETDVHGGDIRAAINRYGGDAASFLDFSANINPLGLPDSVRQAVLHNLEKVVHYPEPHARHLRETLSCYYRVPVDQLTVGNGAVELLYIICHVIKPARVLLCAPTFSEYRRAAQAAGAMVYYYQLPPTAGFACDPARIIAALSQVNAVFLANPNNPTGTLLPQPELQDIIAAAAQRGVTVVVDESFLDFLPERETLTCNHLVAQYPNVIVVHSLTKFFAIPGLRLGFAVAAPPYTARFHAAKDPWNVNLLAQAAGEAALADEAYQQHSRRFVAAEKEFLYQALREISGLQPFPPVVNFIFLDIAATSFTAGELTAKLGRAGVLVRDCSNFSGLPPYYLRVAVRTRSENLRLVRSLRHILSGGHHDKTDSGTAWSNGVES